MRPNIGDDTDQGDDAPPRHLGPFDRLEPCRRRGASTVYRGRHNESGAPVDLEILSRRGSQDLMFEAQIRNRSEVLREIRHRALVQHVGVAVDQGVVAIATEPAFGESLRDLIAAEGTLEPVRAARLIADVAGALDQLHLAGLVHGELTADSIVVDGDHAQLRDVGLTPLAALRPGRQIADADTFAPERIERLAHPSSDVYALGCVALEALTGAPPFPEGASAAKLAAHKVDPPPVPSQRRPELGSRFDEPIAIALAKEPDARYQTAGELGRALVAAAGLAPDAPSLPAMGSTPARRPAVKRAPEPSPDAVSRPVPRRPRSSPRRAVPVLAGLLVVAGVVAIVLALTGGGDASPAGSWQGRAQMTVARGKATLPLSLVISAPAGGRLELTMATNQEAVAGAFSLASVADGVRYFAVSRDGSRITAVTASPAPTARSASEWWPANGSTPVPFGAATTVKLVIDGDALTGSISSSDDAGHAELRGTITAARGG
jgi:serine/threonine-protein kinase